MDTMKLDRRARYTRMILKQSLLELMRDRPITRISVKELCEKADVNRTTFYAHYKDIAELLDQIEDELFQSVRSSLEHGLGEESVSAMVMDILTNLKENGELCKVLFSPYGDKDCLEKILRFAHQKTIATWQRLCPGLTDEDMERLYLFFSNGSVALIREWVMNDMQESPATIALFIDRLSSMGLSVLERRE
ncbi:MAG: TetR/AcrR family transcriptional regulator [Sphaerochaeta sp.]|jgi:AcrR family transcriptional regulator|nr:TetR/AcrR family transcriptional regulator [Sphaerochaeta sp.]MCH3919725.1 TetR/AcrR family transcriptional regulator [Sphaerochaeta sp.]MCI2076210.1 TetR/AcrR family transcriptional regulator [Sphaerochaeta sp.]MCI2097186.1 TetR/AcrR family transcriptional regulator [Sphaerochaeta sp.]MCI2104305.1 TetR/AcrR family transcriptional regulator [Sphaerochaeta sp.]